MADVLFARYEQAIVDRDRYRNAQLAAEAELHRLRAQTIQDRAEIATLKATLLKTRQDRDAFSRALVAVERRLRAAEDELAKG